MAVEKKFNPSGFWLGGGFGLVEPLESLERTFRVTSGMAPRDAPIAAVPKETPILGRFDAKKG